MFVYGDQQLVANARICGSVMHIASRVHEAQDWKPEERKVGWWKRMGWGYPGITLVSARHSAAR
jgi:hypothetical protein